MKLRHLKLGSRFFEVLMLIAALSVLGGYVTWNLYSRYVEIEDRHKERIDNATKIIAVNLEAELLSVDSVLKSVRQTVAGLNTKDVGSDALNFRLKELNDAMPSTRSLFVLNADGTVIASDMPEFVGRNFRQRDYFQIPQRNPDPAVLYVSPPFTTIRGDINIHFARAFADAHGHLAGVVVAALDPAYFVTLMGSVRYAPDIWTSLVHGDGGLFLMVPERPNMAGRSLKAPGSMFSRFIESGQPSAVYSGTIYSTGEDRIIAQRLFRPSALPMDVPLIIAATADLKYHAVGFRDDVILQIVLFSLLALASILGLLFHHRQERHSARILAAQQAERLFAAEEYRSIIGASLDGFWITDTQGHILDVNGSVCRMLGYTRDELLALSIADIEADESSEEVVDHTQRLMEQGHGQFEARHRRKDGSICDVEVSTLYVAALGERFFAFVRDVTERKKVEHRLKQTNAELEQFAYVASHDLRQPLRMVTNYLAVIEKRLGAQIEADLKTYFGFAVGGAQKMDRLITDLLHYSRTGMSGQPVPVPLAEAIANALSNLTVAIDEAGAAVSVADGWPTLLSDQTELTRLFQNLIGNAVKYCSPDRPPTVDIGWRRQAGEYLLWVKDNGIGIAPEQQERAFKIFQRLVPKEAYEGSGIGLAICKKIVERHGGRIWIESEVGAGCTFFMMFPASLILAQLDEAAGDQPVV